MLINDVARFCMIYLVFLMGFASAFFVLFESTGFGGFVSSVQRCFVAMLGDFDMDAFAETPYTAVTVGLLVVYVVTITILLLNLLIAMMGDTFDKARRRHESTPARRDTTAHAPHGHGAPGRDGCFSLLRPCLYLCLAWCAALRAFVQINEAAEMQWHLERARIVFAIENEMSTAERESPANKYW